MANREERRRRANAAAKRRYRVEHADQIAESKRAWRERNPDYAREWRLRNLEHVRAQHREYERERAARARAEAERRERKRQYSHDWYHADIETSRAQRTAARAKARAADPDGYRERRKRHNDAWRASHREEVNATQRERRRRDPAAKSASAQRYYEEHAEERRAYSRRYHEEHRDEVLTKQRQWRQREQRRREAGLPVRRLHRRTPADRAADAAAAAAFFSPANLERLRLELEGPTPPELLEAWQRDCDRIRAERYARRNPEVRPGERRRLAAEQRRLAEEARLDAIGRLVNDRLRRTPRRPEPDPAYLPQPAPISSGSGRGL